MPPLKMFILSLLLLWLLWLMPISWLYQFGDCEMLLTTSHDSCKQRNSKYSPCV